MLARQGLSQWCQDGCWKPPTHVLLITSYSPSVLKCLSVKPSGFPAGITLSPGGKAQFPGRLTLVGQYASDQWNIYKWNIPCHISKQRMSQSSTIAALQREPVSPEETQGWKEYLPSSRPQTAATP